MFAFFLLQLSASFLLAPFALHYTFFSLLLKYIYFPLFLYFFHILDARICENTEKYFFSLGERKTYICKRNL